jgi:predicted N-acetyltransferase YhbS
MKATITPCDPHTFPQFVSMLDHEFLVSRARRGSMADRFPNVLSPQNAPNLLAASCDGRVCAGAAVRFFRWLDGDRPWNGAMVGMVCTRPEYRGQGLGKAVMEAVHGHLRDQKADFGILWTGIPAFYQRFGWKARDRGLFGEATATNHSDGGDGTAPRTCLPEDAAWLDEVRARCQTPRVLRTPADYGVTPPACDAVKCFRASSPPDGDGYALVGEQGDKAFVLEWMGTPHVLAGLWAAMWRRYGGLYVNDWTGSASAAWLTANGLVTWKPQHHAMWLAVSQEIPCDHWHVPYYDRV